MAKDKAVKSKGRKLLRLAAWGSLGLVGLVVVAYFVVTSNTFFQGFILPQVSRSLNAQVTVGQASISPFSKVVLHNLKVQAQGQEPLLLAKQVRARYSLLDMLGGNINVAELVLDTPVIRIIQNADGTSNYDPLLAASASEQPSPPPSEPAKPSAPPQVDLKRLVVTNATFSFTQFDTNGGKTRAEISGLNVGLSNVRNGQPAKFAVDAKLRMQSGVTNDLSAVAAALKGQFNFELGPDLTPKRIQGNADTAVSLATGTFASLNQIQARLAADVDPAAIKGLTLTFTKAGANLGRIAVSGPMNLQTQEGELKVEVTGIGHEVLSLVGGPYGIYFGNTELAASYDIKLQARGQQIDTSGLVTANQFSLAQSNLVTPVIDVKLTYQAALDRAKTNATMREFALTATRGATPFLQANLSKPMSIEWGRGSDAVPASAFDLTLTNLNLADWQAVVGTNIASGSVNGHLLVNVQQAGGLIEFDLAAHLTDLAAQLGSNRLDRTDVDVAGRGELSGFTNLHLAELTLNVAQAGKPLTSLKNSGTYNLTTSAADFQTELTAALADLSGLLGLPNVNLSSGKLTAKTRVAQNQKPVSGAQTNTPQAGLTQNLVASLQLTGLTGNLAGNQLKDESASVQLSGSKSGSVINLRLLRLILKSTARAQNQAQLAGQIDMTQPEAITGHLKLVAEALDLTPYYDLFMSQPAASTSPTEPAPASQPDQPAPAPTEPAPVQLPLRQFTWETTIDRLYLHEISITNFKKTVVLDRSSVQVKPIELALNGAPVRGSMDFNLGVPGYEYAVDFKADNIPLAPIVNTFQPERKGQVHGTLTALTQIKGAGLTPTNLQKNLAGNFDIGTTNLNLKLVHVRSSILKSIINVIIGLPDIIRNPGGAAASIVSRLTGGGAQSNSGWVDELAQSPINIIAFRGQAGNSRIDVDQALVQSPAFQVLTHGPIQLAPIMTNSTIEFPVSLTLRRSLAAKIGQANASTPTNQMYVKLPDFLTMTGTLGEPKKKLNYAVLGKMALQLGSGLVGGTGKAVLDQAGHLVGGLQNVLGGKQGAKDGATNTNAPASKKPDLGGLLKGIFPPQSSPSTNAPANTNAAPQKKPNLGGLLQGILAPKSAPSTNAPAHTNAPAKSKPKSPFDLFK